MCMCVCVWAMCMSVQIPCKPGEGVGSPGSGVTDSSELPVVGAGNWTWILLKSSKCSRPPWHFSSPMLQFFWNVLSYLDTVVLEMIGKGKVRLPGFELSCCHYLPQGQLSWRFILEWVLEGVATAKVCVTGWTLPSVEGKTAALAAFSVSFFSKRWGQNLARGRLLSQRDHSFLNWMRRVLVLHRTFSVLPAPSPVLRSDDGKPQQLHKMTDGEGKTNPNQSRLDDGLSGIGSAAGDSGLSCQDFRPAHPAVPMAPLSCSLSPPLSTDGWVASTFTCWE